MSDDQPVCQTCGEYLFTPLEIARFICLNCEYDFVAYGEPPLEDTED